MDEADVVLFTYDMTWGVDDCNDDESRNDTLGCIAGGGHRQGGRRERNGQAGPKEGEGGITGTEVASKLVKRGRGPPALGSNEVRSKSLLVGFV